MANYHDDQWIMQGVEHHYQEAIKTIPKERIFAVALRGSQNYHLDTVNSDIDTRAIYIPTQNEINDYPTWVPKKELVVNGHEVLTLMDIRWFTFAISQRSEFLIELLYTPYVFIPNKWGFNLWEKYKNIANDLVSTNKIAIANSLIYYITEAYAPHVVNDFIGDINYIHDCYERGYDPKRLYHMYRCYQLLLLLTTDKTYDYSMNELINMSFARVKSGKIDAKAAYQLCRFILYDAPQIVEEVKIHFPVDQDKEENILNKLKKLEKEVFYAYQSYEATPRAL